MNAKKETQPYVNFFWVRQSLTVFKSSTSATLRRFSFLFKIIQEANVCSVSSAYFVFVGFQ